MHGSDGTTSSAELRSARRADVPGILKLIERTVPAMLANGNRQWDAAYPNAEVFEQDIDRRELWVAEADGALAGVAAITSDEEPGYAAVPWTFSGPALVLHRLAVDPAFRGRGIAMMLMAQAETLARQQGIVTLRTDTSADNLATQRLFPKLGYSFAGEITLPFRPGMRVLCFEKQLPPP